MLGIVHIAMKQMVVQQHGQAAWDAIAAKVGEVANTEWVSDGEYEDGTTVAMVVAASELLGTEVGAVLEAFGIFFVSFIRESTFVKLVSVLGNNLKDFLYNLDYLHTHLQTVFPAASFPHFSCRDVASRSLLVEQGMASECEHLPTDLFLTYQSVRGTLLVPFVKGLIMAIASDFFSTPVSISDLPELPSGACELRIIFKQAEAEAAEQGAAVAKQGGELESPKNKMGLPMLLAGLTFDGQRSDVSSWDALDTDSLFDDYRIDAQFFLKQWPWFMLLDGDLHILMMGKKLVEMLPHISLGNDFLANFQIERPGVPEDVNADTIKEHNNVSFLVSSRQPSKGGNKVRLRGAMEVREFGEHTVILFLCSPRILSLEDMIQSEMHLTDIPLHDATRDLVLLSEHMSTEHRLMARMERLQADIVHEQKISDDLLNSMLPDFVVESLREGKKVTAIKHESITVLFSDIVGFTVISASCLPSMVCNMLDQLYTVFDTISKFQDVYKVETIGDAYMIAGGLFGSAEIKAKHAVSVAEQAFAMVAGTRLIKSPVDGTPIRIRVGMHSGPASSGVVGLTLPRYTLFGDTVNMASRMESNGEEGKIHCSEETAKILKKAGFGIEMRGEIEVKGKGTRTTYWVTSQPASSAEKMQNALAAAAEALEALLLESEIDADEEVSVQDQGPDQKPSDLPDPETIDRVPSLSHSSRMSSHERKMFGAKKGKGKFSSLQRRPGAQLVGRTRSFDSDLGLPPDPSDSFESHTSLTSGGVTAPARPLGVPTQIRRTLRKPSTSHIFARSSFDGLGTYGKYVMDSPSSPNTPIGAMAKHKHAARSSAASASSSGHAEAIEQHVKGLTSGACPLGFHKLAAAADDLQAKDQPRSKFHYEPDPLAEWMKQRIDELEQENEMLARENAELRTGAGRLSTH